METTELYSTEVMQPTEIFFDKFVYQVYTGDKFYLLV